MDEQHRQDPESNLSHLRQILVERFGEGELRDLSFDLSIDYESLPAEGKANKARELVALLTRHDRIPELLVTGRRVRPEIPWDDMAPEPEFPSTGPTEIEFVNREDELNMLNLERLKSSRSPYILINAPAGYGKSYLLQCLANNIQTNPHLAQDWRFRYVDFGQLAQGQVEAGHSINYIVQSISGQASHDGPDAAIEQVRDYIVQELTAPSTEGRYALLLIFDSVERVDPQTWQWLYALFGELRRRTRIGHREIITIRVVIAGRDVESFWEGAEQAAAKRPAPQRISLSPFDEHPIQTLVWNRAEAVQIPLDDQTVIEIADEVHYLSGGHPRVIRCLVDDLARQSFAIGPVSEYFEECRERLVRRYLSPVAGQLSEGIKARISQAGQTLSVFRRMNANTVQALVEVSVLPAETDGIVLLGDMQKAHLLNGPTIREPFYRDHLMRRIWALDMAQRSPESRAQHQHLNKIALDLYSSWIHNWGQALPETPLKALQRLLSIVEWLFHALLDQDMDQDTLRFDLQEHIKALSEGSQGLSVADLITDEINKDPEVRYLLRHRLGDDGIPIVCAWMRASEQA